MALTKVKGHIIADDLALGGNPTTSTQSTGNNTTRLATTAFVQTEIAALADSAPAALNTLNELAAALGDDANFSTTVTNSIATKLPLAGGTLTGNLRIDNSASTVVRLQLHNTGSNDYASIYADTASAYKNLILNPTDGNVGIGTTGPTVPLTVNNSTDHSDIAIFHAGGGTPNRGLKISTFSATNSNAGVDLDAQHSTGVLSFSTGGAERMRLSSGKLGIGETTPLGKLHVKTADSGASVNSNADELVVEGSGTAGITILSGTAGDGNLFFDDSGGFARGKLSYSHNGDYLSLLSSGASIFYNGGSERMRILSGGNVGIGTNNPGFVLEVKEDKDTWLSRIYNTGSDSNAQSLLVRSDATATHDALVMGVYADSGYKMVVKSTGNVGIGTTTPTQKLDVAGTALVKNAKLKAIAASNSETAVDVFVYDTHKDSDGGAWRKRTQNTSWYNEALNSSTRGARKEFPSVAVIVIQNTKLTIYDGDDPDMPMWMVFDTNANDMLGGNSGSGGSWLGSVTALNGDIAVASYSGQSPYLFAINFIKEKGRMWHYADGKYCYNGNISTRNDGLSMYVQNSSASIAFLYCRDVAMTVLPNAPIDADTRLPIPTIVVATDRGVSVVKDNGSVVDIQASAGTAYSGVTWVDTTKNDNLIFEQDSSSNPRSIFCIPIPSADRTSATSDGSITDKVVMKFYRSGTHKPYPVFNGGGVLKAVALAEDNQALVSSSGDLTILEPNLVSPEFGKTAYIGHDYNSGWMVGDIKFATLSDTSTTSATSPDLVTNGSNFSNTTGWTGAAATVSVSSSELLVTGTASGAQNQSANWTTISCTKGDQFQVTFRISAFVANQSSAGIIVGGATIHKNNDAGYWYPNSVGTHTTTVTATGPNFTLYLHAGIAVGVVTRFDDISIHKLEHDRSENKLGFQTFGTLPKSVVATGAQLVGYGPFTSNNYLQQSYTNELDFNTGDFAYCFWSNNPATGTEYICDRSEGNGNYRIAIYLTPSQNGECAFYSRSGAATEVVGAIGTPNKWAQIWCIRRGTSHEIWVNGINKVASVGTVQDVSNASGEAVQIIGTRYNGNGPNTGKIALFRVSGTAPTEEQIVKIYNDEKHLFQPNGKATIAGSSDAVTALAYDDDTELLHLGSSWGRSVFQRLNRVEYDSDVVTTAISASNGLVAEE